MKPTIIRMPTLRLLGMSFFGDPFSTHGGWDEKNEIGRLWARFMDYMGVHEERLASLTESGALYEVHVYHPETITKGLFEVFIGAKLKAQGGLPVDLLMKELPQNEYAVFTLKGDEIVSDWHLSIDEWIVSAGYERNQPFSFQLYDERFKSMERIEESVLDVYMPVKKSA